MSQAATNGHTPKGPKQRAEEISDSLVGYLTQTNLREGSKNILRNLAQPDLVLSYLTHEETHESVWQIRIIRDQYLDLHPPQESMIIGETRAYVNNDPSDRLRPLNETQKMQAMTFFNMLEKNIRRSREMKQQEMMKTQIRETRDGSGESDGGDSGILGRLRA